MTDCTVGIRKWLMIGISSLLLSSGFLLFFAGFKKFSPELVVIAQIIGVLVVMLAIARGGLTAWIWFLEKTRQYFSDERSFEKFITRVVIVAAAITITAAAFLF